MADLIITAAGQIKTGTDQADFFTLQTGNFVKVDGLAGNDTVFLSTTVGAGGDLYGESVLNMGGGADSVFVQYDVLSSTISGGAGGDTVQVADVYYSSTINLGDGSDKLTIKYGLYESTVNAGSGADSISLLSASYSDILAGSGADTVTVGYDLYSSHITLGGGADQLTVSAYVDYSTITAGAGTDKVIIGEDLYSSVVQLGGNADTLVVNETGNGYTYDSTINGGAGSDSISIVSAYEYNSISGDAGNDTIVVNGEDAYDNTVYGGVGNDSIFFSSYYYYNDNTIEGGAGADTITIGGVAQVVAFNNASESNIDVTDKVIITAGMYSASLAFHSISDVNVVYNYGNTSTTFTTDGNGYATFKSGTAADLQSRLTILDDNTERGAAVLFDAVDASGSLNRYVFVQGGNASAQGNEDDYLVQVQNVIYLADGSGDSISIRTY